MSTLVRPLPDMIGELSPSAQQLVRDFVESLLDQQAIKPNKKIGTSWAGSLRDYRHQYTSLELQRKALDWRSNYNVSA